MASSTDRSATVVKPPPRRTGDKDADAIAYVSWFWEFYQATVLQSGLLDPSYQADAGTFDPNNLPDPTNSSIAKAQQTANEAYLLALQAVALASGP